LLRERIWEFGITDLRICRTPQNIATRLQGLVREFGEGHGAAYVNGPDEVVPKVLDLARSESLPGLGQQAQELVSRSDRRVITDVFESLLQGLIQHRGLAA